MNVLFFCNLYVLVEYHCTCVHFQYNVFHVNSSQIDTLINIKYVYMLMIGCCGRCRGYYVVMWGGPEDASESSLVCAEYGHVIFCASRQIKLKVEVNGTIKYNALK